MKLVITILALAYVALAAAQPAPENFQVGNDDDDHVFDDFAVERARRSAEQVGNDDDDHIFDDFVVERARRSAEPEAHRSYGYKPYKPYRPYHYKPRPKPIYHHRPSYHHGGSYGGSSYYRPSGYRHSYYH